MIATVHYRIGDWVMVNPGTAPLPDGLPVGAVVRLVGIVQTSRLVEWDGQLFEVNMTNLKGARGA